MRTAIAILLLILAGCSLVPGLATKPVGHPENPPQWVSNSVPQPPPLPSTAKPQANAEEEVGLPSNYEVTLNLFNYPWRYKETGIAATTNLHDWNEVAVLPYQQGYFSVTLSNRPSTEFYRAFNR